MSANSISIVIHAHDAGPYLKECLLALRSDDSQNMEIVVVDDSSSDDTVAIAESLGAKMYSLQRKSGPSVARNLGASKAEGEYLLFLDPDIKIRPGAIPRVREYLDQNPNVAALIGTFDPDATAPGAIAQYRSLRLHSEHARATESISFFWAGLGAVRREVFEDLGGFDGITFPWCLEDVEFGYRMRQSGHTIYRDPSLLGAPLKRWPLPEHMQADLFLRIIPWAQLDLEREEPGFEFLVKKRRKLSVALAYLFVIFLLFGVFNTGLLIAAIITLALFKLLNARLLLFFWRKQGSWFSMKCIPLHLLYHLCAGAGCLYAWLSVKTSHRPKDGNR